MRSISLVVLALVAASVVADIYMHNPRGGNNRLNEANAQRNNANRLFDSQNNNRGGYNVGVRPANSAGNTQTFWGQPTNIYNPTDTTTDAQYPMVFYTESKLQVEYTSQHGCGGREDNDPHVLNCQIVMQYMCDVDKASIGEDALTANMRDGTNTGQVNTDGSTTDQGIHESQFWYQECQNRQRNQGLFIADRNLNGNTAIYTRQNNNGDRSGLECPEERDYYPYWQPTPWKDVAYLTSDYQPERCAWIRANSQNTALKYKCAASTTNQGTVLSQTTADGCANAGGVWKSFTWNIGAVDCAAPHWTRDNSLGNARVNAQMAHYNWTLPTWDELTNPSKGKAVIYDTDFVKCVFRVRYNISTDDYDPWNTNSSYNGDNSPVRNNPTINIGSDQQPLRLAIDTDQFGRTFEDRTHIFYIRRRPAAFNGALIWNLNVRGKRGNIVQTYPGNEYDFVPNRLHVTTNDYIHVQWTGSNTHNNGGNGGDGQTGDAGQGTGGTDRSNLVPIFDLADSYPIPLDKYPVNLFSVSNCFNLDGSPIGRVLGANQPPAQNVECALVFATSGYYRSATQFQNDNTDFSPLLNNAPPSLLGGVVMQIRVPGTYNYMCTRNHNFSNRDQKGTIIVSTPTA